MLDWLKKMADTFRKPKVEYTAWTAVVIGIVASLHVEPPLGSWLLGLWLLISLVLYILTKLKTKTPGTIKEDIELIKEAIDFLKDRIWYYTIGHFDRGSLGDFLVDLYVKLALGIIAISLVFVFVKWYYCEAIIKYLLGTWAEWCF